MAEPVEVNDALFCSHLKEVVCIIHQVRLTP
jgi:hypothetical protein